MSEEEEDDVIRAANAAIHPDDDPYDVLGDGNIEEVITPQKVLCI